MALFPRSNGHFLDLRFPKNSPKKVLPDACLTAICTMLKYKGHFSGASRRGTMKICRKGGSNETYDDKKESDENDDENG